MRRSWPLLGALGRSWAALGPLLGRSWAALVRSWAGLGRPWAALGRSWPLLGPSWAALGRSWSALGVLLGALGSLFGRSWPLSGRSMLKNKMLDHSRCPRAPFSRNSPLTYTQSRCCCPQSAPYSKETKLCFKQLCRTRRRNKQLYLFATPAPRRAPFSRNTHIAL